MEKGNFHEFGYTGINEKQDEKVRDDIDEERLVHIIGYGNAPKVRYGDILKRDGTITKSDNGGSYGTVTDFILLCVLH